MLSFARQLSKRFSLREYICWREENLCTMGASVGGKKNWNGERETGLEHCCASTVRPSHKSP